MKTTREIFNPNVIVAFVSWTVLVLTVLIFRGGNVSSILQDCPNDGPCETLPPSGDAWPLIWVVGYAVILTLGLVLRMWARRD